VAVVEGRPKFVTLFGQTNEAEGWRPNKNDGGCILDVASGEVVAHGLSMPHSPRVYQNRLWVLDSGRGTLLAVDPRTGKSDVV
jgi:uncharacterized protein (TIGR03032 family)